MNWKDVVQMAMNGAKTPPRRVIHSEEEWRELLSPEQFHVMREKGTERAFSGEFCHHYETGTYACACCGTPLFTSEVKYDSQSGWPSFTEPVADNVIRYRRDMSHGMVRVEVMCNVCDAHLGHVFPDGPAPSGLRFCINSVSLSMLDQKAIDEDPE